MPSDSKKREQQKKKDAAKNRNKKIATTTTAELKSKAENGVELTEEGKRNFFIL